MSPFVLRMVSLGALALVACAREPSKSAPEKPADKPLIDKVANAPPRATESPAEVIAKHGPVRPEADQVHHGAPPPARSTPPKTSGVIGDTLETEVSHFKVISMRSCDDPKEQAAAASPPNPAARTVVAAEVEIVAKSRFTFSPRHVMLGKGGITFNGNANPQQLKACSPVVKAGLLMPKDTAKGFVLFDIPVSGPGSKLDELTLVYHPARFGGASQVQFKLAGG